MASTRMTWTEESAYEMLQKGVQASIEQQNNPPAKGKEIAVDDGILGGLKDILFGTTGPRGGKKDGVVQTMAKSAARQGDESDCTRDVGEFAGREKKVSQARSVPLTLTLSPKGRGDRSNSYLTLSTM